MAARVSSLLAVFVLNASYTLINFIDVNLAVVRLSDFSFDLPPELIAHYPEKDRTKSRLLKLDAAGETHDLQFLDILNELKEGDVLVLNDTRVIPARLYGRKRSGGKVEIMLERVLGDDQIVAQLKASKSPKQGSEILIESDGKAVLTVSGRQDNFFVLNVSGVENIYDWFDSVGELPLPPYIKREHKPDQSDHERYQTVFAKYQGAVAAPTAGLHFDENLLDIIKQKGVIVKTVTLHVGAGTYQPVRVDNVLEHKMHHERIVVGQDTCDAINKAKARGNKVIAVGTTVVRSLETAAKENKHESGQVISPFEGETDIFIYPGVVFDIVDKLITNFHLSESTLLMLVSALSSRDNILNAYNHAISEKYRFFSYGDAMFIENQNSNSN